MGAALPPMMESADWIGRGVVTFFPNPGCVRLRSTERDYVFQSLAADGADDTFDISSLPRRMLCRQVRRESAVNPREGFGVQNKRKPLRCHPIIVTVSTTATPHSPSAAAKTEPAR
jgi:hypothetical protein